MQVRPWYYRPAGYWRLPSNSEFQKNMNVPVVCARYSTLGASMTMWPLPNGASTIAAWPRRFLRTTNHLERLNFADWM